MILKFLKKPLKLESYDKNRGQNKNIENLDTNIDYHHAKKRIKCKPIILTLKGTTMTWFKTLEDDLINS